MVLGLTGAVVLAHGSPAKAVAMVLVGLLLGLVGIDVNTGSPRMTFGIARPRRRHRLRADRHRHVRHRRDHRQPRAGRRIAAAVVSCAICNLCRARGDLRAAFPAMLRGTALGSILGVLPGGGAALPSFAAYAMEKKSRNPAQFGRGAIEGVAAPGGRQQCRRADELHSAADARHPGERHDGADGRRDDDPGHPARAAGDDRAAASCSGALSPRCGSAI